MSSSNRCLFLFHLLALPGTLLPLPLPPKIKGSTCELRRIFSSLLRFESHKSRSLGVGAPAGKLELPPPPPVSLENSDAAAEGALAATALLTADAPAASADCDCDFFLSAYALFRLVAFHIHSSTFYHFSASTLSRSHSFFQRASSLLSLLSRQFLFFNFAHILSVALSYRHAFLKNERFIVLAVSSFISHLRSLHAVPPSEVTTVPHDRSS